MPAGTWLTTSEFAQINGLKLRTAQHALARCHDGHEWRGQPLEVRRVESRGGSGGFSYEVLFDTAAAEHSPPRKIQNTDEAQRRLALIRPALKHPKNSRARGKAVRRIAKETGKSQSTVASWIGSYEARGIAGLARKQRKDKGGRRTLISREWDEAVPFDERTRREIADELQVHIRSLWANDMPAVPHVRRAATGRLVELTREAGFDAPDLELMRLCDVPKSLVSRERTYEMVAIRDRDAKRFYDEYIPKTPRTRDGIQPMEMIVGDVHHLDVLVRREDGSLCTPKVVAWQDVATNRIFVSLFILGKGEGIRQAHVVSSFIEMTQDPHWGLPGGLYLDNGGEYNWTPFISDALKLSTLQVRKLIDGTEEAELVAYTRRSTIIRARPYNATAKPIEGVFATLERGPLAMLKGWIGGNRMTKKTHNVGKEPEPYPGTFEEFKTEIVEAISYHHNCPQAGHLAGRSPNQALTGFVESGWLRTDIDEGAFREVFAHKLTRQVRRGCVTYKGTDYYHDDLLSLPRGTTVIVLVPLVDDRPRVTVRDSDENFLCIAEPNWKFGFNDPAGAREQARRAKVLNRLISGLKRETNTLDLQNELARWTNLHPQVPAPESGAFVQLSGDVEAAARARKALPTFDGTGKPSALDKASEIQKQRDDAWGAFESAKKRQTGT